VTPDRAADQHREHHVREHAPQQGVHHPAPFVLSCIGSRRGSYGSSPTDSVGGPAPAICMTAARSAGEAPGSVSHTATATSAYAVSLSCKAIRSSSRLGRYASSNWRPSDGSTTAAYSSTIGKKSGSSPPVCTR